MNLNSQIFKKFVISSCPIYYCSRFQMIFYPLVLSLRVVVLITKKGHIHEQYKKYLLLEKPNFQ